MTQNVRLQNLRDFTVQIRRADNDAIVGTGIAVSTDGKILTCAHVVEAAGIDPRNSNGAEVGVYFPQARGGEEKNRKAVIEKFFKEHNDDVVLLQLTSGASPLAPEQIPTLGTAETSDGNPFRSYGYRGLEKYIAGWADGKIQGCVEAPPDFNVQCEPVQLASSQINAGMSGSAVLDTTRNLIVGIVSETWFPDLSTKDRDTAWAVDGRVLSFEPLGLVLQDMPLPLKAAPEPKTDITTAQAQVFIKEKYSWNSAPTVLLEWTGRDDMLKQITEDWNNPQKRVTGLIGFGGEGKSSLARKWIEMLERSNIKTFDGLFWWGFYENRSIDEFFEAALNFLSGGKIDPRAVPSSSLRAQIIGAMLGAGRYLFVLDGLEVLQHQEGDQYGLLQNNDLRDLLTYFAHPDNSSFCLITSRAPLLDLMEYITYTHRDVDRLSEADGILLLEKLGVKGSREQKSKVVSDWGGHALTISLLGSYLGEKYGGDIAHLADIPVPTADEPRYERVYRVLRRYDEHFTEAKKVFLKIFSLFRMPITQLAFTTVFRASLNKKPGILKRLFGMKNKSSIPPTNPFNTPLVEMGYSSFFTMVHELLDVRILRYDEKQKNYTVHPLVRTYYYELFNLANPVEVVSINRIIKNHYVELGLHDTHLGEDGVFEIIEVFNSPLTLEGLSPFIEAVHHACNAKMYEDGLSLYHKYLGRLSNMGFPDAMVSLLSEFFPNKDISKEPFAIPLESKSFIFSQLGYCFTELGSMQDALRFYERAFYVKSNFGENKDSIIGTPEEYINIAITYYYLGKISFMADNAQKALDKAQLTKNKGRVVSGLVWLAWADYLSGNLSEAGVAFKKAEKLDQKIDGYKYLYSLRGVYHADYLHRIGDIAYARRVTEANLKISDWNHWTNLISLCNRVLGDLDSSEGHYNSARTHYESALKIARGISVRNVLIEVLIARGRFHAKQTSDTLQSFTDLNEALNYVVEGGYRIYEADIRVALGWAYLAHSEKQKAKESAERALQMSQEMGYHWGKVDAEEVLKIV